VIVLTVEPDDLSLPLVLPALGPHAVSTVAIPTAKTNVPFMSLPHLERARHRRLQSLRRRRFAADASPGAM